MKKLKKLLEAPAVPDFRFQNNVQSGFVGLFFQLKV